MTKKPKLDEAPLSEHESGVRKLVSEAAGTTYEALPSLAEARKVTDASVVMEGDYGGQIYVVAPIQLVRCSEEVLQSLLLEIDATQWNDPEGANVYFERAPIGSGVPGGMGGGRVLPNVWVHERLEPHRTAIVAVLANEQQSIRQ